MLSIQQEGSSLSGLIQVNDDEERKDGQAGRFYGCQLWGPGGIQSGLKNDWEQGAMSVMFPVCKATRAAFQYIRRIPALSQAPRQLESCQPSSQNNEAWMDECAARLQPLVDQYKPKQHQTFAIEKFRDLIVITREK